MPLCPLAAPSCYLPRGLVCAHPLRGPHRLAQRQTSVRGTRYHCSAPFCPDSCLAGLSWARYPFDLRALCHASTNVGFEDYQPVFDRVRALVPIGMVVTLLADSGFVHEQLILAIATLHFTSIGLGVVRARVRRWVDTHWDRGLSYLKIGWRWLRQQYRRGWQAFASFWLDPTPDLVPAIASRRGTACPHRQWVVCHQC